MKNFTHTKQHDRNNQNNDINVGFTSNTKFIILQLRQGNKTWFSNAYSNFGLNRKTKQLDHMAIWYNTIICTCLATCAHFINHQISVRGLLSDFIHIIHPYTSPSPKCFSFHSGTEKVQLFQRPQLVVCMYNLDLFFYVCQECTHIRNFVLLYITDYFTKFISRKYLKFFPCFNILQYC